MGRIRLPSICMITDDSSCESDQGLLDRISKSVRGGVNMVHLRNSKKSSSELYYLALQIRSITLDKALFFVNDRVDIAIASDADGVQLKESSFSVQDTRKIWGDRLMIGRSIHSLESAIQSQNEGADFLLGGTVFKSETHKDVEPNGLHFLTSLKDKIDIPIIAIGGITEDNVGECIKSGANGVAMIRSFSNSKDPEKVARNFHRLLNN